ncbi:hypothetical protein F4808DRAFT_466090 [Astrocystis sublimbata]|nr:hypothetical protein F4808DRAFT_466090 [Astrocystis sublimbata]
MSSFVPSPRDLDLYKEGGLNLRFTLGCLDPFMTRENIELVLEHYSFGHGPMIVYWPKCELKFNGQVHGGWCHVFLPESEAVGETLVAIPKSEFARIERVQISEQQRTPTDAEIISTNLLMAIASGEYSTAITIPAYAAPGTSTNQAEQRLADERARWDWYADIHQHFQAILRRDAELSYLSQNIRQIVLNKLSEVRDVFDPDLGQVYRNTLSLTQHGEGIIRARVPPAILQAITIDASANLPTQSHEDDA